MPPSSESGCKAKHTNILRTFLLKGHPSEYQLGTKISRGKLYEVIENHICINEAEPDTGSFTARAL